MKKFDSVIFDMDGVLVANDSYCRAIIKTVEYFLWSKMKIKTEVTTKEILAMKKIAGFNNDWDVSYALVSLLGRKTNLQKFRQEVEIVTQEIRGTQRYQEIKDIFQSFYLGVEVFNNIYKKKALVERKKGLIVAEILLLKKKVLRQLKQKYRMAIATSRPRFEALFAVKNLGLLPLFFDEKTIVAKEDCVREKPFPDPLFEAKRRIKSKKPIYIGDTINDAIAAKKAGMPCIFIGNSKLGDYQLDDVNKLGELLL